MMNVDFDVLLGNVEREAQRYETTAKAVLFTFDGRPINPPDEQEKQMERFLAPVRAAVTAVHELAEQAQKQAAVVLTSVDADPLHGVPTEDLTRMAALEPLLRDEIEDMDIGDLQKRLLWAVNHADGPTRRLYVRHAAKRLKDNGGDRLLQPLRNLEDSMISPSERAKRDKAIEQAQAQAAKAQQASFAAEERLRRADGRAAADYQRRMMAMGGPL